MSTNRSFVKKVMTQLKTADQHHRDLLAPFGLELGSGVHVDHLELETEFVLQRLQGIEQVVAQVAPLPAEHG